MFDATRDKLPAPIYDEDPDYVRCYWKALELAFRNLHEPAPQSVRCGKPSRGDFVGWTGIGPIAFFIEYTIGIKADALSNVVTWDVRSPRRVNVRMALRR